MAQDINRVLLIGNVTRDFELRKVGGDISTASFTIAVNRAPAQDGTSSADYPQIVVWRRLAEICAQYLHKGSKVAVDGKLRTRTYEKNGQTVYVMEVVADQIQFLTPRNQYAQSAPEAGPAAVPTGEVTPDGFAAVDDSELPFD